jgi:hypothetical protein
MSNSLRNSQNEVRISKNTTKSNVKSNGPSPSEGKKSSKVSKSMKSEEIKQLTEEEK